MTSLTFLGTGNFLAPGRYWNSFLLDGTVLVEPSPSALPNLRRCSVAAEEIDAVVISHFHPDHTFGWPFLLLEFMQRGRDRPLFVVGPPGVEAFLADMLRLGAVTDIHASAHAALDIRYVEIDGSVQEAGSVRFRGIRVDHVPHLECFGYVLDRGGRRVGYSGDTSPCPGLDELAGSVDVLVLECNGRHPAPAHMDIEAVRSLRTRFPNVPFVLTHLGADVEPVDIPDVVIPSDFETLSDV